MAGGKEISGLLKSDHQKSKWARPKNLSVIPVINRARDVGEHLSDVILTSRGACGRLHTRSLTSQCISSICFPLHLYTLTSTTAIWFTVHLRAFHKFHNHFCGLWELPSPMWYWNPFGTVSREKKELFFWILSKLSYPFTQFGQLVSFFLTPNALI